jgi:D-glycero-alpha-D-manno-heptose 1-phosphate guanylyltransferase
MEAIVLAGGFGTRLKSVVADVPKPMAPINGRPFLEILLETLVNKGFTRAVLSVGYLADLIVAHFGSNFNGLALEYEIEETPLGTGGAIMRAMKHCRLDHVFVFNGDTFLDLEVSIVEECWIRDKKPIIVAREVPDSSRYGGLDVVDGQVVGFFEKGKVGPGLINAGCYVFPSDLFKNSSLPVPFSVENDFLAPTVLVQPVDCFVSRGHFIDIGIPEDYARASIELCRR